jgi:hypothetical protein
LLAGVRPGLQAEIVPSSVSKMTAAGNCVPGTTNAEDGFQIMPIGAAGVGFGGLFDLLQGEGRRAVQRALRSPIVSVARGRDGVRLVSSLSKAAFKRGAAKERQESSRRHRDRRQGWDIGRPTPGVVGQGGDEPVGAWPLCRFSSASNQRLPVPSTIC